MIHFRVFAFFIGFLTAVLDAQTQSSAEGDFLKWTELRFLNSPFATFSATDEGLAVVIKGKGGVVLDGDLDPKTMVGQQESGYRFIVRDGHSASVGSYDVGLTIVSITINGIQAFGCEELAGLERGPFGEEGTRTYSAFRIGGHELIEIPEEEAWEPLMAALGRPKQPTPTEAFKIKSLHHANRASGLVAVGESGTTAAASGGWEVLRLVAIGGSALGVIGLFFLFRRLRSRDSSR